MVCPSKGKSMCKLSDCNAKRHVTVLRMLEELVAIDARAQLPIFVLNLVTMPMDRQIEIIQWLGENLASFRAAAGTARAASEPVLIELGNEFYLPEMYACKLGSNVSKYVEIVEELVPHIRAHLPSDTRIAVVGYSNVLINVVGRSGIDEWNAQLNASGVLEMVDAVTLHDYSMNAKVPTHPPCENRPARATPPARVCLSPVYLCSTLTSCGHTCGSFLTLSCFCRCHDSRWRWNVRTPILAIRGTRRSLAAASATATRNPPTWRGAPLLLRAWRQRSNRVGCWHPRLRG